MAALVMLSGLSGLLPAGSAQAQSQVYFCNVDGKPSYQAEACEADAIPISLPVIDASAEKDRGAGASAPADSASNPGSALKPASATNPTPAANVAAGRNPAPAVNAVPGKTGQAGAGAMPAPSAVDAAFANHEGLPWAGLRAGMSLEAVHALMPGAQLLPAPDDPDAIHQRLRQSNLDIDGMAVDAGYYFAGNRLFMVMVVPHHQHEFEAARLNADARAEAKRIEQVFTQRYGQPSSRQPNEIIWVMADRSALSLNIRQVLPTHAIVALGYRPS